MIHHLWKTKEIAKANAAEACGVIPFQRFAEIGEGEDGKNGERDDFLDDFQLRSGEFVEAHAVGRHLKIIFETGQCPN